MALQNRRSFGAVRFDAVASSPTSSLSPTSRRRRSIAVLKENEAHIEENDDEAERMARRGFVENGSPINSTSNNDRRQSTFGLSAISSLSASEMNNQIAQCIKLSAENKINDKNAFQLKMIDFLVYTLKKQDPKMTNLQMASASLDASAKIYGFRVDKVHSDLLKIIGMVKQDKKENRESTLNKNVNELESEENELHLKKKKKKTRHNIISTEDSLKGSAEVYDPLSLIRSQRDTQTSDMLFQAGMPQHADQGFVMNLFNDVILDKIVTINYEFMNSTAGLIDEFKSKPICSAYEAFNYLHWSPDEELKDQKSFIDDRDGEYHFDLDAAISEEQQADFDVMMDCDDIYEDKCDRLANNTHIENIVDFHDIIANNPNPNVNYEYSYFQRNYRIHWAGPSHWKITLNKNMINSKVIETCKQNAAKKKKEIEVFFSHNSKEETKVKFSHINRQTKLLTKTTKLIWSEDKVSFPQETNYEIKRYYNFFNKPSDILIDFGKNQINRQLENDSDEDIRKCILQNNDGINDCIDSNDGEYFGEIPESGCNLDNNNLNQESLTNEIHGAFIGENLVSLPKLTDKIFIPYSQRAKKIDMRQLKKAMWKNLKNKSIDIEKENFNISQSLESDIIVRNIQPKAFSNLYSQIPKVLSKVNIDSLSPSIAFVSLLHLANEKNLKVDRYSELSDLTINCEKLDN